MVNPAKLLKFRKEWGEFETRHPKFVRFIMTIARNGILEGSIIEIKVTAPDGTVTESNMRVSAEDMEMVKGLQE
ncbi:MAG: hypothetical protein IJZ00_06650 [Lachnospiraceae bacterium]|nr:hypothetical protein [Lachnospiraceae bacterium]MBQ8261945.1 hypothetical protein [Lachnospiraceae bacterium]